ncbi:hypothetical protein EZS27_000339 [termite gut metagenome]|uniref:Uncharacterized protein n=1 Tax=termite gut metagenome TaxID=433724 RepID=A0A5J4T1K5_9ZZZZ
MFIWTGVSPVGKGLSKATLFLWNIFFLFIVFKYYQE